MIVCGARPEVFGAMPSTNNHYIRIVGPRDTSVPKFPK